jgi:hypothetical protein
MTALAHSLEAMEVSASCLPQHSRFPVPPTSRVIRHTRGRTGLPRLCPRCLNRPSGSNWLQIRCELAPLRHADLLSEGEVRTFESCRAIVFSNTYAASPDSRKMVGVTASEACRPTAGSPEHGAAADLAFGSTCAAKMNEFRPASGGIRRTGRHQLPSGCQPTHLHGDHYTERIG